MPSQNCSRILTNKLKRRINSLFHSIPSSFPIKSHSREWDLLVFSRQDECKYFIRGWDKLWVAFIVWAEYFPLGAKPSALKIIYPAFIAGVLLTAVSMSLTVLLAQWMHLNLAMAISLFVVVGGMVYIMRYFKVLNEGSLPYFNGISMLLAVYFTSSHPELTTNAYLMPWVAALMAILAGILGGLLGWFNISIMFTRKV